MTIIKKFQPIDFDYCAPDEECGIREPYCWGIANFTDPLTIQFDEPDSLLDDDIIVGGAFPAGTIDVAGWFNFGAGNDWADGTNEACVTPNSKYLRQAISISECDCYKLVFDLTTDLADTCDLTFELYDGSAWTVIETWNDIDATDDLELCFCAEDDYTHIGFKFEGTCDGDKCIDNVRLFPFRPTVKIKTCDNEDVDTISTCDINLYCTHWNVVVDAWSDYVSDIGCYKICIEDAEFIVNGTFTNKLLGWDQTGTGETWSEVGGRATVNLTNIDNVSKYLEQDTEILQECEHTLTYTIVTATAPFELRVYVNDVLVRTDTTTGNKSVALPINTDIEKISFRFAYLGVAEEGFNYELDNVSIQETICSKCVCLDTHDCTLLLSGTQDNDARDFYFDDDFTFWLRISAELLNSNPTFDDNISRKSNGYFNQLYGDVYVSKDLTVYAQPNYIWEAMFRMIIFNEFRIEGTEYIKKEGDPEIVFKDNFGEGIVEVVKKKQHHRN